MTREEFLEKELLKKAKSLNLEVHQDSHKRLTIRNNKNMTLQKKKKGIWLMSCNGVPQMLVTTEFAINRIR